MGRAQMEKVLPCAISFSMNSASSKSRSNSALRTAMERNGHRAHCDTQWQGQECWPCYGAAQRHAAQLARPMQPLGSWRQAPELQQRAKVGGHVALLQVQAVQLHQLAAAV